MAGAIKRRQQIRQQQHDQQNQQKSPDNAQILDFWFTAMMPRYVPDSARFFQPF
jgi:hypothetical protein